MIVSCFWSSEICINFIAVLLFMSLNIHFNDTSEIAMRLTKVFATIWKIQETIEKWKLLNMAKYLLLLLWSKLKSSRNSFIPFIFAVSSFAWQIRGFRTLYESAKPITKIDKLMNFSDRWLVSVYKAIFYGSTFNEMLWLNIYIRKWISKRGRLKFKRCLHFTTLNISCVLFIYCWYW